MGIWSAVAGAANAYLQQDAQKRDEEREMRKLKFLEELQMARENRANERDLAKEQRQAEREQDRYNMDAEQANLDRADQRALRERQLKLQEDQAKETSNYRKQSLALQAQRASASGGAPALKGSDVRGYEAGITEAVNKIDSLINPVNKNGRPEPVDGQWKSNVERALQLALQEPDLMERYRKIQQLQQRLYR